MAITFKPFLEKLGGTSASSYIGNEGELFYDPSTGSLRLSNGSTPGGQVVSSGGSSGTILDISEQHEDGYNLSLDDANSTLVFNNQKKSVYVRIMPEFMVNFPIGTTIAFIVSNGTIILRTPSEDNDEEETHNDTVYSPIEDFSTSYMGLDSVGSYVIIKVAPENWHVYGPYLFDDD
jgi:hypothetical protein